jgi:hypothetical protein
VDKGIMKRTISVFFLLAMAAVKLPGQNYDYGLYKSWQDYKRGTLLCALNPDSSKDKIKLHHLLSGRYIDLKRSGKRYRYAKDSIFGYSDEQQHHYRFYKSYDKEYLILENGTITIYLADISVRSSYGKNTKSIPTYFFSKELNSEILPLTILNLKRAFPDDLKFHNMLDMEFGGGEPLSAYSAADTMYKVNLLLTKSKTQ